MKRESNLQMWKLRKEVEKKEFLKILKKNGKKIKKEKEQEIPEKVWIEVEGFEVEGCGGEVDVNMEEIWNLFEKTKKRKKEELILLVRIKEGFGADFNTERIEFTERMEFWVARREDSDDNYLKLPEGFFAVPEDCKKVKIRNGVPIFSL